MISHMTAAVQRFYTRIKTHCNIFVPQSTSSTISTMNRGCSTCINGNKYINNIQNSATFFCKLCMFLLLVSYYHYCLITSGGKLNINVHDLKLPCICMSFIYCCEELESLSVKVNRLIKVVEKKSCVASSDTSYSLRQRPACSTL